MLTATVNALRDAQRVDLQVQIEPETNKKEQMKQAVRGAVEQLDGVGSVPAAPGETAVEFADRCGFTKFMYQYEYQGRMVIVDIMDPSRTDQFNESVQ